ncbi:MAG: PAS domain S-box protein [Acidobacteriota bacterium]
MAILDPGSIPDSAKLAAIVESSGDAIISKDLNGIITSWNAGAELLFGYTPEQAIGQSVTILIPPERFDEEPDILSRIRRGEKIDHYETIRIARDGRRIDISLNVSPVFDDAGNVIGASKIARDVTDRKLADAELAKYAAIVESSTDAIISKDLNGIITSWNKGAEAIFGYTVDEIVGRPVTILMPEDRVNEEPGILERIRRGEAVSHYETVRRRKDGSLVDISLNVSPVYDAHGKIVGASKIARDITEHNRVESAVHESEMMRRLVNAQEAERRRIARDLHDHIGQQMTGIRLKIERLLELIPDADPAATELRSIRELAVRMDRDIGFLSWELRPIELDSLGLENALRSFLYQWSSQYNIASVFDSDDQSVDLAPLPHDVETGLYRILQESVNNIVKHAAATEVTVFFHRRRSDVGLIVEDNGIGFDYETSISNDPTHGLGLMGMRERVELLHGTFEVESEPGHTSIIVQIPIG